jgi:hypothetical protein
MRYQVEEWNGMIGKTVYGPSFATIPEADDYITRQAVRSRSFMRYGIIVKRTGVRVPGAIVAGRA